MGVPNFSNFFNSLCGPIWMIFGGPETQHGELFLHSTSRGAVISVSGIVGLIVTHHEWRARNINRWRERTRKTVSVKCNLFSKNMKVIESHGKCTVESCHGTINRIILRNSFSDFPSTNYAKYYSTKRKSAKMPSEDSSFQLISYSSIFASNF